MLRDKDKLGREVKCWSWVSGKPHWGVWGQLWGRWGRKPWSSGKAFSSHKGPEAGTQGLWDWRRVRKGRGVRNQVWVWPERQTVPALRAACFFLLMRRSPIGDEFRAEGWCDVTHTLEDSSHSMLKIDWRRERRETIRIVGKSLSPWIHMEDDGG